MFVLLCQYLQYYYQIWSMNIFIFMFLVHFGTIYRKQLKRSAIAPHYLLFLFQSMNFAEPQNFSHFCFASKTSEPIYSEGLFLLLTPFLRFNFTQQPSWANLIYKMNFQHSPNYSIDDRLLKDWKVSWLTILLAYFGLYSLLSNF